MYDNHRTSGNSGYLVPCSYPITLCESPICSHDVCSCNLFIVVDCSFCNCVLFGETNIITLFVPRKWQKQTKYPSR
ncbi:unnamed protein product [Callosobruchus maculatus]|uniref:Uncharacterized protein n=1 Tax=Callosobruchus maculatus TaxID=64391 RepID=A0A653BR29_CALMS|nr:unnamed protein product [Callosobruchus maculatus]